MQDRVAFYNKRIDSKKLEVEKLNRNYNSISLLHKERFIFWNSIICASHNIIFIFS